MGGGYKLDGLENTVFLSFTRKHLSTSIDAVDVAYGEHWVCVGLNLLSAAFFFDPLTIHLIQPPRVRSNLKTWAA